MVTITLYARQKKRHRCIEQSFGLCWRAKFPEARTRTTFHECEGSYYKEVVSRTASHSFMEQK